MPFQEREIDRRPVPKAPRKMKVVIVSASRTGTLGLYSAMKILGYTPYHMKECVFGGAKELRVLNEGVYAELNRAQYKFKRYDEDDFRKWFAEYDCIVEMCSFFEPSSIPKAYLSDPDVKFLLTERDPTRWAKSVNNTTGVYTEMFHRFPLSVLQYFNAHLGEFSRTHDLLYFGWSGGTWPGENGNIENLRKMYINYIETIKRTVPAERLKVIRLEDGLDWNSICPFLGVPVPKEPYPDRNEPEKFKATIGGLMGPLVLDAALKLAATIIVPALLGWGLWRYSSGSGFPAWMGRLTG